MNKAIAVVRLTMMGLIASVLIATLTDTSGRVPTSLTEIATYFTFQANLLALFAWATLVYFAWRGRVRPRWLEYARVELRDPGHSIGVCHENPALAPLDPGRLGNRAPLARVRGRPRASMTGQMLLRRERTPCRE